MLSMYRETPLEAAATSTLSPQAHTTGPSNALIPAADAAIREPKGERLDVEVTQMNAIDGPSPGGYGCGLTQLVELISERNTDGMER